MEKDRFKNRKEDGRILSWKKLSIKKGKKISCKIY